MAYTVAIKSKYNEGPFRCNVLSITADAATQSVDSGLDNIDHIVVGIQSATTASIKIYPNSNASGVETFGYLGISGAASGDVFYVKCYGR